MHRELLSFSIGADDELDELVLECEDPTCEWHAAMRWSWDGQNLVKFEHTPLDRITEGYNNDNAEKDARGHTHRSSFDDYSLGRQFDIFGRSGE